MKKTFFGYNKLTNTEEWYSSGFQPLVESLEMSWLIDWQSRVPERNNLRTVTATVRYAASSGHSQRPLGPGMNTT